MNTQRSDSLRFAALALFVVIFFLLGVGIGFGLGYMYCRLKVSQPSSSPPTSWFNIQSRRPKNPRPFAPSLPTEDPIESEPVSISQSDFTDKYGKSGKRFSATRSTFAHDKLVTVKLDTEFIDINFSEEMSMKVTTILASVFFQAKELSIRDRVPDEAKIKLILVGGMKKLHSDISEDGVSKLRDDPSVVITGDMGKNEDLLIKYPPFTVGIVLRMPDRIAIVTNGSPPGFTTVTTIPSSRTTRFGTVEERASRSF